MWKIVSDINAFALQHPRTAFMYPPEFVMSTSSWLISLSFCALNDLQHFYWFSHFVHFFFVLHEVGRTKRFNDKMVEKEITKKIFDDLKGEAIWVLIKMSFELFSREFDNEVWLIMMIWLPYLVNPLALNMQSIFISYTHCLSFKAWSLPA